MHMEIIYYLLFLVEDGGGGDVKLKASGIMVPNSSTKQFLTGARTAPLLDKGSTLTFLIPET